MKKLLVPIFAILLLSSFGCSDRQAGYGVGGAAVGAGIGAIAGGGKGAAIGAGAGAAGGLLLEKATR